MRAFAAAVVSFAAAACLPTIDYVGKRCFEGAPCPPGYVCGSDQRCAREGADGGTSPTDGGEQVDSGLHFDPARCADPEHFPSDGWETRHFTLPSDLTIQAKYCVGVEDVPGEFIARDYGLGGIAEGLVLFVSRWTATRRLTHGAYNFDVKHDDGLRIFLDGKMLYENWMNPDVSMSATITPYLPDRDHQITVEHNNRAGVAFVFVHWDTICNALDPSTSSWAISYYRTDATGTIDRTDCIAGEMIRDHNISMTWTSPSPPLVLRTGVTKDFAIVGRSMRAFAGPTLFSISHTDTMRLIVGTSTIYERVGQRKRITATISADLKDLQEMRFEMVDLSGAGSVSLSW